jgi:uncharacterized protein
MKSPGKERSLDPRALDVAAFCRHAGVAQGQWPITALQRLTESLSAASDGTATWQANGQLVAVAGGEPELWLSLTARAEVPLTCQRCLQALLEPLQVDRRFRFVRDEEEAARLDEESEDDVLALPPRLDLQALLEDELLLALPIVPRHASCPQPLPMPGDEAEGAPEEASAHPFAALAALKKPS